MQISFKVLSKLSEESRFIRTTIFVDEQHFEEEFDLSDNDAIHILLFADEKAVGNARIIYSVEHNSYIIGRVAILKEYRQLHLGRKLMEYAEKEIIKRYGHILIGVSSQEQASGFYEKVGYQKTSLTYLDQGCPHVWMVKQL